MPLFDFASLFAFCDLHASRIWRTNPRVRRRALGCYDRQGFPIPQAPPWPGWWRRFLDRMASEEGTVAEDELPDGSVLSTVWLGLDQAEDGPPLLFETTRESRFTAISSSSGELEHFCEVLPVPDPADPTGRETYVQSASEEEALAKHHEILRRLRVRLGH